MFKWINSIALAKRIAAITLTVLIVVVTVNYIVFITKHRASATQAIVEKAAAFTAVADEAKNHVAALNNLGTFDTAGMLEQLKADLEAGKPYSDSKIFGTIPVVAGWTAAQEAAERENIDFRITSYDVRNKKNEPAKDSFEGMLLTDLTAQVNSGGEGTINRINNETNSLHYMRAITLGQECMLCHGDPADSLTGDGKDVLGFTMENWKPGFMHGSYHVVMPLAPVDAQVADFITGGLIWTIPLIVISIGVIIFALKIVFGKPVHNLLSRIRDIAEGEGDLTQRIEVSSTDELGELGKYFNNFVERIHDLIASVAGAAHEVAGASTEIAASAEEMSTGMSEQTGQITQVSAAVEQMSASVIEVARKSAEAANSAADSGKVAAEGGDVVTETITGMQGISDAVSSSAASVAELGKRGEQIGQIIEVINDIADQTNLLALNAAIEAARAGEHGRGFAVVADEVRKLADRTTKATEEIGDSIKAIQTETDQAVNRMSTGTEQVQEGVLKATQAGESLKQIVSGAQEVSGMIQSIAAAAEQQSSAAEEISRNVQAVSAVANQVGEGTAQSAEAAAQLSLKAEQLRGLVGKFKIKVSDRRQERGSAPPGTEERRSSLAQS